MLTADLAVSYPDSTSLQTVFVSISVSLKAGTIYPIVRSHSI
jgi:hypothetical protein